MKQSILVALFAVCSMVLVVACTPISPDAAFDDGHAGSATSSYAIEGTTWTLAEYAADGVLVPVPADVTATIGFGTDQSLSLQACNSVSATFVADGNMLTIAPGAMTLMACEGALGEVEGAIVALLPAVLSHTVADGVLSMQDADGNVLATWRAADAASTEASASSLDGTTWVLTDYSDGSSVIAVPEEVVITGGFADGQFTGKACNNYFTSFTESGASLSFGVVGATMMFCEGAVGQIESLYFAALESVTNFAIEDGVLKFLDDNGNLLAAFADANTAMADPAHVQEVTSLSDTHWQVTGYMVDGEFLTPDSSFAATLDLGAEGAFSGKVCNSYRGEFTTEGNRISFGPAAMTMMMCPGAVGEFEPIFHALLSASTQFEMVGNELTFSNSDGEVTLQFAAYAPATLEGAIWNVVGINNQNGGVQSLAEGTSATATFADGTVSGSAGCNTFTAAYTLDGASLTIGPAASTMMMCADPADLMTQETNFLVGLENVATWEIFNGVLTLRDAEGATQITFVP